MIDISIMTIIVRLMTVAAGLINLVADVVISIVAVVAMTSLEGKSVMGLVLALIFLMVEIYMAVTVLPFVANVVTGTIAEVEVTVVVNLESWSVVRLMIVYMSIDVDIVLVFVADLVFDKMRMV